MYQARALLFGLVMCVGLSVAASHLNKRRACGADSVSSAGLTGETMTLRGLDDREVIVGKGSQSRWTVLCFLGTECPLAKLYGPRLQRLADEFADQGIAFVGVMSNSQDSPAECLEYANVHSLDFPVVKDVEQRVADMFAATRTPEVVVIDRSRQISYRGRIDDQYQPGVAREQPKQHDLRDALLALISGEIVSTPETVPVGCIIGRRGKSVEVPEGAEITYADDIAPLLEKHCVECHRDGQIGPFAMSDYDEVSGWAVTMLETIDDGRMPPWHAAPPFDRFLGARHLSDAERDLLAAWIEQGMPAGDLSKVAAPADFVDGWSLPRSPDVIIEMAVKPMKIPAEGTVEYQYFVADPGFEEDRWVKAAQVVPGNSAVVHHAICFVRPPDGSEFRGLGWLGGYVPGQEPAILRDGMARKIPAGSKFVFQMHYTPTGKPEEDITRVGIVFADPNDVTEEVVTLVAINQSFEIPPGSTAHSVTATLKYFPRNGKLLSLMPHMHYRGKAFAVTLNYEDGSSQEVLDVPRYDFNWQHDYRLAEPIDLSGVGSVEFEAIFDNSAANPWNPAPEKTVMWGDQTWEEMAVAFFDVARPLAVEQGTSVPGQVTSSSAQSLGVSEDVLRRRKMFVDDYFARLDVNQDGVVRREELPKSLRAFGFRQMDADSDGVISREDVEEVAEYRIR